MIPYSQDIYKILSYGNTNDIAVRESEKIALLRLCDEDYTIKASTGYIVGDKIYIKDGQLKGGVESIIKKIDRHKRKALIELNFLGETRKVFVSLEVVQKT